MAMSRETNQIAASEQEKYRPIAELGHGGMADVYLAVTGGGQGVVRKLVVLKVPKNDFADSPAFLRMFLDEARLAARLNHSNVVQTYDVTVVSGRPVIVMEYLDG